MVCAQVAVAALIEMRADDVAAARTCTAELTGALRSMGGAAPAAALSSFTAGLDHRLRRIAVTRAPLPLPMQLLVRLLAVAMVGVPPVLLLLP